MTSIFWFRRDLRLSDNRGLFEALNQSDTVYPVFVFDSHILERLPDTEDKRIHLIWDALQDIKVRLNQVDSDLLILFGDPVQIIPSLTSRLNVNAVYTNRDYEPYATQRDSEVEKSLESAGIQFRSFKDHVIFQEREIVKPDGKPYVVYTPYSRTWRQNLTPADYNAFPSETLLHKLKAVTLPEEFKVIRHLEETGFLAVSVSIKGTPEAAEIFLSDFSRRMKDYAVNRDFPSIKGVSYLSPYLRFGQLSIRACVREALKQTHTGSEKWLNELIWRDFYSQILWHFPEAATQSFNPVYRSLQFPNDEGKFQAWCLGKTGFPIVDAAMRQLNQTGWMHNRLRMVAASFLVKDLHVDWRWGEAYFAEKLLDFDLASNNGGWQWAASTGCDAQPYFRIFNPVSQSQKFDPEGKFIKKYVQELERVPTKYIHQPETMPHLEQEMSGCRLGTDYPSPIVNHALAREEALRLFRKTS